MDVNRAVEIFSGHGFESAAQVHATYSMSHHGVDVRVEVLDFGQAAGNVRYMATAWQPEVPEEERVLNSKGLSIGNAAGTVDEALEGPHWWIFT
ncbi:hypothetical protein ACR8AL_07535 [Clavibacter sepedonicus]|nr:MULTISPECIES: hypothetical protein [Clavibacter]MBD5382453.1 hypothetical protein [Clavibacter sp.]UUK67205.1 hypothetical protein LRE50_15720 [Clavibacter sepedonicus]